MTVKSKSMRLVASLALAWALVQGSPAARTMSTVIMSGLDSPHGLAIGPEGALYVVEAGHGGTGPCAPIRGITFSRWDRQAPSRAGFMAPRNVVLEGLPSILGTNGDVAGPQRLSFQGRGGGYLTIGLGAPSTAKAAFGPGAALLGTLVKFTPGGRVLVEADLRDDEGRNNPDRGADDTNPFGVLALPGAEIVTDAGGNSLLRVEANGDVSTVATFPSRVNNRSDRRGAHFGRDRTRWRGPRERAVGINPCHRRGAHLPRRAW